MKSFFAFLLLTIISYCGYSQSDKESISSLSFKLGKWKWETKGLTKPGDPKVYQGIGYSHIYYVNDSTAIFDDHGIEWENGISYKAVTYRTFDEALNKFLVVWAQANTSNTTKIQGHWEGDKFIELEHGTDNYGKWTNRMEIYDIQPNSHKAKLVRTYESGFSVVILEYIATRITN